MNFRNPAAIVLFFSLFIVMVGFGIIIPVVPFYARDLGATSVHMGLLMAVFSLMQFICAPIWGSLSDQVGRKPMLLLGLLGFGVSFLIIGLSSSLWLLFVARFVGGVLSSAAIPSSMAFVADITSEEERGSGMGVMGAAMGLGLIMGPAIGGLLAGMSLSAPFFVAAAMSLLNLLFALLLLPESLPAHRRVRGGRKGPQLDVMVRALAGPIGFPLVLTLVATFAVSNLEGMFAFWIQDKLGYGASDLGGIFVVMGITTAVVQAGVAGRLMNAIGDEAVVRLGLFLTTAGFLALLAVGGMLSLLVCTALWAAGGATLRPALSTIISKRAQTGQGAAMGMMGSFDSLGRIVGPLWGGMLYQQNISYPYVSGAAILASCTAATFMGSLWRRTVPVAVPISGDGGTGSPEPSVTSRQR